jgi:hypothetical protein
MFHGGRFWALAPYLCSFVTWESCQKRLCYAHAFPSAVQAEARLQGRVSHGKFNTMPLACRGMVLVAEREREPEFRLPAMHSDASLEGEFHPQANIA